MITCHDPLPVSTLDLCVQSSPSAKRACIFQRAGHNRAKSHSPCSTWHTGGRTKPTTLATSLLSQLSPSSGKSLTICTGSYMATCTLLTTCSACRHAHNIPRQHSSLDCGISVHLYAAYLMGQTSMQFTQQQFLLSPSAGEPLLIIIATTLCLA